jgi:hypothetical protein
MTTEYRIGLYDENRNLIGYKADSFWSLSKRISKLHGLVNGKIREVLIKNLAGILNVKEVRDAHPVHGLVNGLKQINKERFFGNFETMLIGYSDDAPLARVTFTHRVFSDGIEELSSEEAAQLNAHADAA